MIRTSYTPLGGEGGLLAFSATNCAARYLVIDHAPPSPAAHNKPRRGVFHPIRASTIPADYTSWRIHE